MPVSTATAADIRAQGVTDPIEPLREIPALSNSGTREPGASATIPSGIPNVLRPDGSLRYPDWLEAELDRRAGGNWPGKPVAQRLDALAALDTHAFA